MIVGDATTGVLHSALRGLAEEQRVVADNVANVNTPHFLAGTVSFEDALREAVASGGDVEDVQPTVERSLAPTNANGNNVNLDDQMVEATKAGLSYQLALRALDNKYSLLRTAMRSN